MIEAVQNRGYHLIELPDLMKTDEVRSWLSSKWLGKELYYQESVDSTNTWAKKLAEEGAPNGTVVLADEQTAGKGRRGRTWKNPKGANIAATFFAAAPIYAGRQLLCSSGYGAVRSPDMQRDGTGCLD